MAIRSLQCVRRYYDSNNQAQRRIHLLNIGKYASIFFVVFTGALCLWLYDQEAAELLDDDVDDYGANPNVYFYLWIIAYLIGFTCTYLVI